MPGFFQKAQSRIYLLAVDNWIDILRVRTMRGVSIDSASKHSGWVRGIYSVYESPEKQTIHITNNTRRQYNKYIIYKYIL